MRAGVAGEIGRHGGRPSTLQGEDLRNEWAGANTKPTGDWILAGTGLICPGSGGPIGRSVPATMKTHVLVALASLSFGGLLLAGCTTAPATATNPVTRGALVGHWKSDPYIHAIDLKLNSDGTFEMALYTFDIEDDRLKGDWNVFPENRLVLTFRESKRHQYGFPIQYVRLVEDVTARSFSLRQIETFFNPLEFVRAEAP